MKNLLLVALVAAVVTLGALSIYQARELRQARNERDAAAAELKAAADRTQDAVAAAKKAAGAATKVRLLQDTLALSSAEAANQSEQVTSLQGKLEAERTNSPEAGMARLLSSPEMRKSLQHQRQVLLDPMLDRMYGTLFEQLHLNADQAAALKDLLKQRTLAGAEKDLSAMDPNLDVSKRKEVVDESNKEKETYNEQIRQFLGDDSYKQFQAYDKTIGDRNTVDQFASQMQGNAPEFNPAQREQLIQALHEERGRFNWSLDIGQVNAGTADYSQLTDARLDQYGKDREQFNAVILERARQFLTPEQLVSLDKSLALQRQMILYSMKMSVKMMR